LYVSRWVFRYEKEAGYHALNIGKLRLELMEKPATGDPQCREPFESAANRAPFILSVWLTIKTMGSGHQNDGHSALTRTPSSALFIDRSHS